MTRHDIRKEYRMANGVLALGLIVAAGLPWAFSHYSSLPRPQCVLQEHTGQACSSCGLTRSVCAFYQGRIQESRDWHPAGISVVWLAAFQLLLRGALLLLPIPPWGPWADLAQLALSAAWMHLMVAERVFLL